MLYASQIQATVSPEDRLYARIHLTHAGIHRQDVIRGLMRILADAERPKATPKQKQASKDLIEMLTPAIKKLYNEARKEQEKTLRETIEGGK